MLAETITGISRPGIPLPLLGTSVPCLRSRARSRGPWHDAAAPHPTCRAATPCRHAGASQTPLPLRVLGGLRVTGSKSEEAALLLRVEGGTPGAATVARALALDPTLTCPVRRCAPPPPCRSHCEVPVSRRGRTG